MVHHSEDEVYSLYDAIDAAILMHRDAHFGGQFPFMIEYYEKGGKGINPEFELERIKNLARIELEIGDNLAAMILQGADAEKVARAKEAYKTLRDIYEIQKPDSPYPRLIADLILSEEEHPQAEIDAIVACKHKIVPALMDLIHSEDFKDPLFPGYGLAPTLAAECLGLIGDKRGIMTLFGMIGEGDFFEDEAIADALFTIGAPAKDFLMRVLQGKTITEDNERAAIALHHFKKDPEVAKTCFNILKSLDLKKHLIFASYLILACEGLPTDSEEWKQFEDLSKNPTIPKELKGDFQAVLSTIRST